MFIDILGILQVLALGAETLEQISDLITFISGEPEPDYSDLTPEQKTEMLKELTKVIARLGLDLNCFPVGYTTTLLFDTDGNPLP